MATNETLIGHLLAGRYRLQQRRGTGAHGIVLDAVDEQLQRPVAVKILLPQFAVDTAAQARFRFEAQAASSLTHPNLNAVYDWGVEEVEGAIVPFLVLEHLSGGSLRDILDRGRLLSPSQALVVGLDACRGLDYMHRRGVAHLDLKPANLAFGDDRHLRVLDVGLSRLVAEQTWVEPSAAGIDAARYSSPEQARGGSVKDGTLGTASDIYSLCLVLIESVTGQVPFSSDSTMATLNARHDKLMPVSADFGPLASVLERAGRPESGDRYTAAEFGRALVQAAEKLPRPAPIPIVGTSLFVDSSAGISTGVGAGMRRPTDPTGPTMRPVEPPVQRQVIAPAGMPQPGVVTNPILLPLVQGVGAAPVASPVLDPTTGQPYGPTNDSAPGQPGFALPVDPTTAQPPAPPLAPPSAAALPEVVAAAPGVDVAEESHIYDQSLDEPRRRRTGWILGVIVLIVALAASGLLAYRLVADRSHAVPALTGLSEAIARNQVAAKGWTVVVQTERNDEQPRGSVIRTDPPAGVKLKEGQSVIFVVSEGPTMSKLPDVKGMQLDQATQTLTSAKLDIAVADQVFDEVVAANAVISQTVPVQPNVQIGGELMQRTVVAVVVSKGPSPRQVPNLIGMDEATATATLASSQLKIVRAADIFSPTVPAGQVADQSLPAGTSIQRDEAVTVAISKGPDFVAMPALDGLDHAGVQAALTGAGLTVGKVTGNSASGLLYQVSVNGAAVATGQQLQRGTAIDLFYF